MPIILALWRLSLEESMFKAYAYECIKKTNTSQLTGSGRRGRVMV